MTRRRAVWALAVAAALLVGQQRGATAPVEATVTMPVRLTAYSYESCSDSRCLMASGQPTFVGAAACSAWAFPLGTRLYIHELGETVTCLDRGAPWWFERGFVPAVDVWRGSTWEAVQVGSSVAIVTVVGWGE